MVIVIMIYKHIIIMNTFMRKCSEKQLRHALQTTYFSLIPSIHSSILCFTVGLAAANCREVVAYRFVRREVMPTDAHVVCHMVRRRLIELTASIAGDVASLTSDDSGMVKTAIFRNSDKHIFRFSEYKKRERR